MTTVGQLNYDASLGIAIQTEPRENSPNPSFSGFHPTASVPSTSLRPWHRPLRVNSDPTASVPSNPLAALTPPDQGEKLVLSE